MPDVAPAIFSSQRGRPTARGPDFAARFWPFGRRAWRGLVGPHVAAHSFRSGNRNRVTTTRGCGNLAGELYATRADWPVAGFTALLGRDVRTFGSSPMGRIGGRATRFARAFQRLNRAQLTEIFWDKYDPGYRWRSRLSPAQARSSRPVILVPSAYTNVSRSACKYARFLPERQFLFVATRNSGLQFDPPANGSVAHLAAYGKAGAYKSATTFLQGWSKLQTRQLFSGRALPVST